MKFTIAFNADIMRAEHKVAFKEAHKEGIRKNNMALIPTFIFLSFALIAYIYAPNSAISFTILSAAIGGHYLVNNINYRDNLNKSKRQSRIELDEVIRTELEKKHSNGYRT
ncbi:MAG: hypothetical protein HRT57_13150 [Crocinitomicaceae bacterium]|nr:hypothetical protein [Crocinitomicaceae bacterium]